MATLYLGTRRYSSWSLRGWLAVRLAGLAAEEVVIPLAGGATPAVAAVSPTGTVPYLVDGAVHLPDSLAILEYCAELAPLWPADRVERAHARAIACEMHGGFAPLRAAMPMNLGRHEPGFGRTPAAMADVARIAAIWTAALAASGGPFLFGAGFGGADAMFAPVVARFVSYEPPLGDAASAYVARVRAHPLMAEWYALAAAEPPEWRLGRYEAVVPT